MNISTKHAIEYCDLMAGVALHDPEGTPDRELSNDYQQAANIIEHAQEER